MREDLSGLTPRQRQVLAAVKDLQLEKGYPPSVREVAAKAHLSSPASAHDCLKVLKTKGFLASSGRHARTLLASLPPDVPPAIPLLEHVDFTARSMLVMGHGRTVPWQEILPGSGLYALRVRDDSMSPELLKDDFAVVRPQPAVLPGALVVVAVDGEAAVRRLVEHRDGLGLKSAAKTVLPLGSREVLGRVIAVIRAYH